MAAFNALPEPHLILTPDLIMVHANQARIAATGVPREAFFGRHIFEVFPDNPDDEEASGVANLGASLARVIKHRAPDAMAIQRYDIPTGEGTFEERYWLPLNFPVLSDTGELLWIVHRVEDVTESVRREHAAEQAAIGQHSLIARLLSANAALSLQVAERAKAEEALRASEAWLKLLLDSAAEGVYAVDREGTTILCNSAFLSMLGFDRESDALGQKLHDVIHHTRPDGCTYPRTECPIYRTAQSSEPAHVTGESFVRLDGTPFPVEYWVRPIIRNGQLEGAVCTFHDVTERQKARDKQEILVRELDHRVKNLFSIVTAIVRLSARSATSVRQMADDIKGRVLALAAAHELASTGGSAVTGTTNVHDLVQRLLAPHLGAQARVHLAGPHVPLSASQANGLALILHELATNAVKYGGLSGDSGSLSLIWQLMPETLQLQWEESGGPLIDGPPARKGFGTVLTDSTAQSTLGGQISYDWRPDGLAVQLLMPFDV